MATFVQVVQAHAEEFLQNMNSKVLAPQLRTMNLIPQAVETNVRHSLDREDANAHLLNHLKEDADQNIVEKVFRVASEKSVYPLMSAFATKMLRALQQATMRPWNKEALNSMRGELGGAKMDGVMINKLKKSDIPNPDNVGFLSKPQLEEVKSEKTPIEQMNKVIDYLLEVEDEYFENFCRILEQGGFTAKGKMLREKAKDLRKSVEFQFPTSPKELDVSLPKIEVSSLQAEGGSDPPEKEDLLADEAALKRLCWIPFDIKTVVIEAEGGILCLEPTSDDIQVAKEDTIFVEVPPDAVSTSADVKMRYAIIPSGAFTLPEGYQFGSPVVYIYYDGRRVTKPLALHLPHWYGGEDHARDGLSFAVAPHSLKERSVYHFQLLAGGKFPVNSRYGVVEIGGHCSLFTTAFESGATVNCQAFSLIKENEDETECKAECNIAVTNAAHCWRRILLENRPGWEVSQPNPFQFKSDKITATLKEMSHVHGDWRAYFTGVSELLSSNVQYDVPGIHSKEALEDAVKASAYPPAIKYIVKYNKELRRTGRSTEVTLQLHISDTDQRMDFPYTVYERIQVAPPPHPPGSSPTMHSWKKRALKSMRKELGGVNMVDTGMIKELEKLDVPNNMGFLSQVQLQVVESERTHAGRMNKVIDYLVEMEDKYFENFCTILEENNFEGKAKMLREKAEELKKSVGGHEDVKAVERSPPEAWHSNAMVVGANVGPETDEHEYKSFMVPTDKTKKPPPMRPCKDDSEVLKKVVDHSKEINAMLNHRTGGSIHFGIHDDGIVEEGLDLPQAALIDKLQTRVGQLLQVFYPAVQSRFVAIQPVNLVNRSGEPTGQWRFDICVTPYDKVVLFSRHQTVAYYRQGGNSEPMPADMMERLRVERQQK